MAYDRAVGETVNIGSGTEISISGTLDMIKKIMKSDVKIVTDRKRIRPKNSEVFRLFCDNTKISKLTGFKPEFTLEKGLERTIRWFMRPENLSRYKADIYNV